MSIRTLLSRVDVTTEPSGEIKPIKSLDKMAEAIRRCTAYRVTCEAELAKLDNARSEVLEQLAEATRLEDEAKAELRDMVKNVCGVRVD